MFATRSWVLSCLTSLSLLALHPVQGVSQEQGAKKEALKWLADYRIRQMIFHDKDIQRIQETLEKGTEEEAQKWLSATKSNRDLLDSARWRESQKWLRDFLRVQAIYSDEELGELRNQFKTAFQQSVKEGSIDKFVELLLRVENKRLRRKGAAETAAALRARDAATAKAWREEAARSAAARAKRSAARIGSSASSSPTYEPRRRVRYSPPLINSMGVARRAVYRAIFGGWRRGRR